MTPFLRRFMSDESGTTAIEYAMVAVLISTAIFAAVQALSATVVDGFYGSIVNAL